jgi:uncharacterized RDD family membrane protein YckC
MDGEKEQYESLSKYSTFWARFWAISFDSSAIIPITYIGLLIAQVAMGDQGRKYYNTFSPCLIYIYYIVMHGICGRTFGKRLFGIKLYTISEKKIGWRNSIAREILPLLITLFACIVIGPTTTGNGNDPATRVSLKEIVESTNGIVMIIYIIWEITVFISMAVNEKRRSIQDKIAGTIVIKKEDIKIYRVLLAIIIGAFITKFPDIMNGFIKGLGI